MKLYKDKIELVYLLFLISGAAGLIYEIVWTRMLVLIFGSSTHSVSAVISAFLGGLAIGSLIFGRIAQNVSREKLLRIYSYLEFGIAGWGLISLVLIRTIIPIFSAVTDGSSNSPWLLLFKFLLAVVVLLPSTVLMGGTLPTIVKIAARQQDQRDKTVAILYAVNTFGGVAGVLFAGFIAIELFGLTQTLILASGLNTFVGSLFFRIRIDTSSPESIHQTAPGRLILLWKEQLYLIIFGVSGLVSIAYEILWTRLLTPINGTFIYSFSIILSVYLLGITFGSFIYKKIFAKFIRLPVFAFTEVGIGAFAFVSVYLVSFFNLPPSITVWAAILPSSVFMGMSFPACMAEVGDDSRVAELTGVFYFSNTIGAIIGGMLASFVFIPHLGTAASVMFFSAINLCLALLLIVFAIRKLSLIRIAATMLIVLIFADATIWLQYKDRMGQWQYRNLIQQARAKGAQVSYLEDDTASVLGYGDRNKNVGLYVDGVPITSKVSDTKLMAYLPIALHPDPKSMLDICFGMGTTFRSAVRAGLSVDAVELSPSVPKMFPLIYSDASNYINNKNSRIIINDGRNYVALTHKKYDLVTIDPPPPFNAAGTTVLYSEEFYKQLSKILNSGGLVSQWIYFGSREDDVKMAIRSFAEQFAYVEAFEPSLGTPGVFLIGSKSEITLDPDRISKVFDAENVKNDFHEVGETIEAHQIISAAIADRSKLLAITADVPSVTDNRPRTEYFLLRHKFKQSPDMTGLLFYNLVTSKR